MPKLRRAYALATILILMGVALFGVGALVTISGLETRISRSQQEGVSAYYAADAGMSDAVWRLNNNTTYATALRNGNLNVSYTATNAPQTGQGFAVTMVTDSTKGAGYGIITVNATSDNGTFVAKRKVEANVFSTPGNTGIGTIGMLAGGNFRQTAGSGTVNYNNADLYSGGNIAFENSTQISMGNKKIMAVGNYTKSSSSTVSNYSQIQSANTNPPAATPVTLPSVDFNAYQNSNNASYTANAFVALLQAGGSVNLPGPVTYVNGNVNLTSVPNNTVVNVTGKLIIRGNFSIGSSVASRMNFNINDPGNNEVGIIISGNTAVNGGRWTLNGVWYSAGNLTFTSVPSMTLNAGVVAAGNIEITPVSFSLSGSSTKIATTLDITASPSVIQVQHWEEEY